MLEWGYERQFAGYSAVCGIDEAGRGPLAGPVVAAAVILPEGCVIEGLDDSKKLSEKKREALFGEICERAVAFGIAEAGHERIDEINILQATFEAMRGAVAALAGLRGCGRQRFAGAGNPGAVCPGRGRDCTLGSGRFDSGEGHEGSFYAGDGRGISRVWL